MKIQLDCILNIKYMMTAVTSRTPRRLINFGFLYTEICKDHRTLDLSMTRTWLNLRNLRANRGGYMTGPHHYFGSIKSDMVYIIDDQLLFHYVNTFPLYTILPKPVTQVVYAQWYSHTFPYSENSLFPNPGELYFDEKEIVLTENTIVDLSMFRSQIVSNDVPWSFNYSHNQTDLKVITYHYDNDYVNYAMSKDGLFLEWHHFVQSITPTNPDCGGFVTLARWIDANHLELAAVKIPYGYTLIINDMCIHGDSNLVGTYMMAMTADHTLMATADTVFTKTLITTKDVPIKTEPPYCNMSLPVAITI